MLKLQRAASVVARGPVEGGHDAVVQLPRVQSALLDQGRESHHRRTVQRTGRSVGRATRKDARRTIGPRKQPRRPRIQGTVSYFAPVGDGFQVL